MAFQSVDATLSFFIVTGAVLPSEAGTLGVEKTLSETYVPALLKGFRTEW